MYITKNKTIKFSSASTHRASVNVYSINVTVFCSNVFSHIWIYKTHYSPLQMKNGYYILFDIGYVINNFSHYHQWSWNFIHLTKLMSIFFQKYIVDPSPISLYILLHVYFRKKWWSVNLKKECITEKFLCRQNKLQVPQSNNEDYDMPTVILFFYIIDYNWCSNSNVNNTIPEQ